MIAKVATAAASYGIDKPYDYFVPVTLHGCVDVGSRVWVPFGKGNRKSEGIVLSIDGEHTAGDKLKPILSVMEDYPIYDEQMIKLANFMRERYYSTFFEAARCLVPASMWQRIQTNYFLCDGVGAEQAQKAAGRSIIKRKIVEFMLAHDGGCTETQLARAAGNSRTAGAISELCEKGIIYSVEKTKDGSLAKTSCIIKLACPKEQAIEIINSSPKKNPIHFDVIDFLGDNGEISKKQLMYLTGVSAGVLATLEKRGVIEAFEQEVYRRPSVPDNIGGGETKIELNSAQQAAVSGLKKLFDTDSAQAALVYGVTGSGKTKVYIEMIKYALANGKGAILLVPEISLTPQLASEFISVFGDNIAVLHSALSDGERIDEWRRIRRGEAKIALGTRSAVFAPVHDLSIILIDEEQERTYQSEESPRYDAREIAKFRCAKNNGLVVFGSATPSIDSYYNAQRGVYSLFKLGERFGGTQLPEVIFADMRGMPSDGGAPVIGRTLREQLEINLKNNEQSILFLNRRGTSRQITCSQCGYVPMCGRCSAQLRYHEANGRLICHLCGYSEKLPEVCPMCGGAHLKHGSAGTQKAERELREIFPNAGIVRMDADTTSGKQGHEKLLDKIYSGEADILIGTQMITKGLDFEKVSLVGVVDADMSLYCGDFRAAERTFSIITQVIGRAGRRGTRGRAVIQTFTPGNPVLAAAARQDYESFYNQEIAIRRALNVPPVSDLIGFTLSGREEGAILKCGMALVKRIEGLMNGEFSDIKSEVLGPVADSILKVNGRYRYHVTFRAKQSSRVRAFVSGILREFLNDKANRGVSIHASRNSIDSE